MNDTSIQVGSTVTIISYNELYDIKDVRPCIVDEMLCYANKMCTIKSKVEGTAWYKIKEDGGKFVWPATAFREERFNKTDFLKLVL